MKKNNYKKEQLKKRIVLTIFSSKIFSFPILYKLRNKFYKKEFNIGKNPIIEHNVWIQRTHGKKGFIKIGSNVLMSRNTSIDYTGAVTIEDNVWLSEGCSIFSHIHKLNKNRINRTENDIIQSNIILRKNCWIGTKVIILPQAKEIGKNSVIAAGSVVTKPVPPDVMVAGNPAKIIKHITKQ